MTKPSFAAWMALVDALIAKKCFGLSSRDLPDIDYLGHFEDGASPSATATAAIRNAKD